MREAIGKLEMLGMIMRTHGVGTFVVNDIGKEGVGMSLSNACDVTAVELFEARYAVEPAASAMSVERRASQDVPLRVPSRSRPPATCFHSTIKKMFL